MIGGSGDDRVEERRLFGGSGDDVLQGDGGEDVLYGGPGNDTVYSVGDGAADIVDCGAGTDTVVRGPDQNLDSFVGCERVRRKLEASAAYFAGADRRGCGAGVP